MSKNNKVVFKFSINKEEVKVRKLNNLKPTKFFKDKSKYNRKEFKLNKKSLDSFSFIYIYIDIYYIYHQYLGFLRDLRFQVYNKLSNLGILISKYEVSTYRYF